MPLTLPDSPQINRIAWRLTAGLAAIFSLLAVLLHQDLLSWAPKRGGGNPLALSATKNRHPLAFAEIERRVAFCAEHVTLERCFVIFQNGTCVIVDEPVSDPIGRAKEILTRTSGPEARFITRRIENGHLMVTYREPVFHCLFSDEIARLQPRLKEPITAHLSPSERHSMPPDWSPPEEAKLGLMTRTSLNQDAAEMQIAKVVRSRPVSTHERAPLPKPPALPSAHAPGEDESSPFAPLQVSTDGPTLSP